MTLVVVANYALLLRVALLTVAARRAELQLLDAGRFGTFLKLAGLHRTSNVISTLVRFDRC